MYPKMAQDGWIIREIFRRLIYTVDGSDEDVFRVVFINFDATT